MKNKIIMTLILLSSFLSFAQMKITWKDLSKVKFVEKYFPDYEEYFLHPYFSSSVKILDGVKITITGYFLDIDPRGKLFILSKGPMSSCFSEELVGPKQPWNFNSLPNLPLK